MEVARLAGVSHQTVSRYLRRNGGLRPETVQRIDAAVAELDYHPNLVARSMRTRRTGRLAIVLPSIPQHLPGQLLAAAAATAHEHGFEAEIMSIDGTAAARGDRIRDLVANGQVEGVLSLTPVDGLEDRAATPTSGALVIAADYDEQLRGIGALADGSIVEDLIRLLVARGHRRFLHIAGPDDWSSSRGRRQVYERTIAQMGLESHGVVGGDWHAATAYDAVRALPDDCGVTAIIAVNDNVAIGAIRAARERGWRVPEDVSVTGWDDLEMGRYTSPTISTVAIDREAQGREEMLRLIALVRGTERPARSTERLNRVLLRESVGPAPRRR
jgi:LacI family transcriptional regulator, repressor for deo operon, udp, cdd, tsx, nupC, and nupG